MTALSEMDAYDLTELFVELGPEVGLEMDRVDVHGVKVSTCSRHMSGQMMLNAALLREVVRLQKRVAELENKS